MRPRAPSPRRPRGAGPPRLRRNPITEKGAIATAVAITIMITNSIDFITKIPLYTILYANWDLIVACRSVIRSKSVTGSKHLDLVRSLKVQVRSKHASSAQLCCVSDKCVALFMFAISRVHGVYDL